MRSVTIKPPTTLIVAKTIAAKPIHFPSGLPRLPATIRAPTMVIPEIALAPLINGGGVWVVLRDKFKTNKTGQSKNKE